MSEHSTQFEAAGGGLVLRGAILLYRSEGPRNFSSHGPHRGDAAAFASMHAVEHDEEGRPTIAAGVPLSRAHLRQWTEALGRTVRPELLPENVLVAHPDMLAWWVPEQVRPAYFDLSTRLAGLRVLTERTVVPVPYPAHLFIATRSRLGVYALPVNERPTADTRVLHSPILNVFVNGSLCWGNIPIPRAIAIASIPEFERAVFDSWSTHPNPGQEFTVSGKGGRATLMPLGKAKKPLMGFLAIFLFLAMVMPMFVLVMETFQITTGNGYGLDNLTLYNWIGTVEEAEKYTNMDGIFRNKDFLNALWNTIRLTLIASIITAICGQFLGYISSRGRGKWYGNLTEQMVFVPYLMSGVAFSTMYFSMFSVPHFGGLLPSLYGTFTLIVLTSVVKHFPFASKSGTANMLAISTELEEAADIAGASFWKRMASIIIPLAKNGFISGFMLTFISIAKELDLIIILMTPTTRTMSYLAFTYSQDGYNQMADAISVVVLLFILVCYIIANKFGADIGKSWG